MNATFNRTPAYRGFEGMLKIVRFNWRVYALTIIASCIIVLGVSLTQHGAIRVIGFGGAFIAMYWVVASLVASHWIYDKSEIYRWTWIANWFSTPPKHWAFIHAGLDESSETVRRLFPKSTGRVFDIFDPDEMTETSIIEARRRNPTAVVANFRHLPATAAEFDTVFLIFAAHELRRRQSRQEFFLELKRALTPTGKILIVEHLRDWKNFLAFGPGFLHFLPRKEWLSLAEESGLRVESETSMTPFVRVVLLTKEL